MNGASVATLILPSARLNMSYPLLQKPLYAYSLPPQLLDILSVRNVAPTAAPEPQVDAEQDRPAPQVPVVPGGALSCQTCGNVVFADVEEQRRHFRSDWHRFNVAGKGGVTEEEFEGMDGEFESSVRSGRSGARVMGRVTGCNGRSDNRRNG